jgi:hypothetical protein
VDKLMNTVQNIRQYGLMKLAQGPAPDPQFIGQMASVPSRAFDAASMGVLSAPTPEQASSMNDYMRSGIVGGITGGAIATLLAAIMHRPILPHLGVGTGAGLLAGLARQYDKDSDPPGLSPVYTIPSGFRLGALTGAIAGVPLGRFARTGMLAGGLTGAISGGVSGGAVSNFY